MHHASRLAVIIGLTLCWLSPLAHATSWIIELTNGRALTTTHVWEEGEELKFVFAEGTAGVPRALVKRITTAAKRATPERDRRDAAGQGPSAPDTADGGALQRQAGASQADREQKVALTTQFDEARKNYLEAMSAKNPDAEQRALDDMQAVSKQLYALADAVKVKHGGVLPAWWNK
jgi:hypothetical protein